MNCIICNIEHNGEYGSGLTCSKKCMSIHILNKTKNKSLQTRKENFENRLKNKLLKIRICEKCGAEYTLQKLASTLRFCSRSCANTRIHTKETKDKIANSVAKNDLIYINCAICNKEIRTRNINKKCCSRYCQIAYARPYAIEKKKQNQEWKNKISITRKKLFADNKLNVSGGRTKWRVYKNIKVQGSYELRTCVILDKQKQLGIIKDWEYTNDRIIYKDHLQYIHSYLFDFKILTNDNDFYYIETKGYTTPLDKLKWQAAKEQQINLIVWFEQNIIEYENMYNIL